MSWVYKRTNVPGGTHGVCDERAAHCTRELEQRRRVARQQDNDGDKKISSYNNINCSCRYWLRLRVSRLVQHFEQHDSRQLDSTKPLSANGSVLRQDE